MPTNPFGDHGATADVLAVHDLLAAYADAVDTRDFAALRHVFTRDARASYGGLALEPGIQAIVDHVSGLRGFARSQHLLGNVRVRFDGAATARSSCVGLVHLVRPDGALFVRGLRYRHTMVRTDDGWRIDELVHTAEWMWEGTANPNVAPADLPR